MEPTMTFEQIQKAEAERLAQDAREREEWEAEDRRRESERQEFQAKMKKFIFRAKFVWWTLLALSIGAIAASIVLVLSK